jgi:NADH-quinone oxidoreductase subunit C
MPADPVTLELLNARLGDAKASDFRGDTRVAIARDRLLESMQLLKSERGFDLLVDVTCVDYLNYRDAAHRFGLVYLLASTETNERLTVRVYLDEPELTVPSMCSIWAGANWFEREAFDMFGIEFIGHPDLRRILMPEEFTAFPLRKDYPLQGRGERHNFQRIARNQA